MSQDRSFAQYVDSHFCDQLSDAVCSYVHDHIDGLDLKLYKVKTIGSIDISRMDIKSVKVYDLPDMGITFDVIVDAEISVTEADHHYDEEEIGNQWFMVKCRGDLSKNLEDFQIVGTEIYTKGIPKGNPLSDALVPIIRKEDLERTADDFIKKYYHEAYATTKPVDPTELAKRMNLTVKVRSITKDCSIFGQVYFHSKEAELYNDETDELEKVHVEQGTILVDKNAYFLRNLGKVNNTIVHECVHWDKHRKAFELERLYNEEACRVECEVIGGIRNKSGEAISYIETQANILAPRIQMPLYGFKRKAAEYINSYRMETRTSNLIDIIEPVIEALAIHYGVSKLAAKIRMLDVGYIEAAGAFIYVDNHYVRAHVFKRDSIKINQTFTISSEDAAIERFRNLDLKKKTANGEYLFVENHYVYNAPKYVGKDLSGKLQLTDYALTHMDECCLVFDLKIDNPETKDYYSICVLNRDVASTVKFRIEFNDELKKLPEKSQIAFRKQELAEYIEVRKQMTDDPKQCIELLLKWRKMDRTELSKQIQINPRTLTRISNAETQPAVETAALICFGLHVPPIISEKLMEVFGCPLLPRYLKHQCIKEALAIKYPEPIAEIRKYLEQFGVNI